MNGNRRAILRYKGRGREGKGREGRKGEERGKVKEEGEERGRGREGSGGIICINSL